MKKTFLLATVALFLCGSLVLANGDNKKKDKTGKARTEKCCTKTCPKPGKPCCDKSKCTKS